MLEINAWKRTRKLAKGRCHGYQTVTGLSIGVVEVRQSLSGSCQGRRETRCDSSAEFREGDREQIGRKHTHTRANYRKKPTKPLHAWQFHNKDRKTSSHIVPHPSHFNRCLHAVYIQKKLFIQLIHSNPQLLLKKAPETL